MKMRSAFASLAACSFLVTVAIAGCADQADDAVEVEESGGELNSAGRALIGSYVDDTGAFRGLVLTNEKVGQRNRFFADVDTGIRCIKQPCPSAERIEGTFTAGTKTITLYSTTASKAVQHLLGKFNYVVQGQKLSLARKGFAQSLSEELSYCAEAADCYRQEILHPMCLGAFACTAESTCKWACGAPADPCASKKETACLDDESCQPVYGSSFCSSDGICTMDYVFKSCETRPAPEPPPAPVCLSSNTCAKGKHCSTEDGVCNPHGLLAVCAGTCVANAK